MKKIGGIVLAAGCGKRMGMPKAVIQLGDKPLGRIAVELLQSADVEKTVIVIGCKADFVLENLSSIGNVVENKNWKMGQFSSLLKGFSQLDKDQWALVLPVDVVGVRTDTVKSLIGAVGESIDADIPVHNGKKGHPVLISPQFRTRIEELNRVDARLDHLLREAETELVDVADGAVVSNVNTLDDLEILKSKYESNRG